MLHKFAAQHGSTLRLLHYVQVNSEDERKQAQQVEFSNIKTRKLIFNKIAT